MMIKMDTSINIIHSSVQQTFIRNVFALCVFESNLIVLILLQAMTDDMLIELKSCFMEAYDDNQDGKIDIREVRNMLTFDA